MIENFLTTEQVASILQVHPFTILKFIKQGKLIGVKLGRVYRIKESDVQAFLDGRTTGVRKSHQPANAESPHNAQELKQALKGDANQKNDLRPDTTHDHKSYRIENKSTGEEGPHYYII